MLRAGNLSPDGTLNDYLPTGEKAELKAALIFRRVGTTTPVNNPEDID